MSLIDTQQVVVLDFSNFAQHIWPEETGHDDITNSREKDDTAIEEFVDPVYIRKVLEDFSSTFGDVIKQCSNANEAGWQCGVICPTE